MISIDFSKGIISSNRFEYAFEKFCWKIRILAINLFSNSSPSSTTEKVGLFFTIVLFGVVVSPIALSDADPYHIKGIFEEVKGSIPLIEDLSKNQETQYTLIVHLKISHESHFATTENVILGKYRSSIS